MRVAWYHMLFWLRVLLYSKFYTPRRVSSSHGGIWTPTRVHAPWHQIRPSTYMAPTRTTRTRPPPTAYRAEQFRAQSYSIPSLIPPYTPARQSKILRQKKAALRGFAKRSGSIVPSTVRNMGNVRSSSAAQSDSARARSARCALPAV